MKKFLKIAIVPLLFVGCSFNEKAVQIHPPTSKSVAISCPWNCGCHFVNNSLVGSDLSCFYAEPKLCKDIENFLVEIKGDMKKSGIDYSDERVYNNVTSAGLYNWEGITTGMGWTGWWVALSDYCEGEGYWESSNAESIAYGDSSSFSIKKAKGKKYSGKLIAKRGNSIAIEGIISESDSAVIQTPTFNSPFIYFENVPDGKIKVFVNSEWKQYKNVSPDFISGDFWLLDGKDGEIFAKGTKVDNLFYELGLKKVELTRNGQNFETKQALISFLEETDFFQRLGLSDQQKTNSMNYLIPKIQEASNYYLTILDAEATENISKIKIDPIPQNIIRRFFAIYPSDGAIKTEGGLQYPEVRNVSDGFMVKEYGEILVDKSTYILWK
ncbi:hypothetical protein KAI58_04255 [Candidatus Gracilibacteria bacterium]|nr:hypothetical protein [Candidatus Gracilibacteria bacterium]